MTELSDVAKATMAENLRRYRRERRETARSLIAALDWDFDPICRLFDSVPSGDRAWLTFLSRVARLETISEDVRNAFRLTWTFHGVFARSIGNRPLLARALRILMPCDYQGPPLHVYRGACRLERRRSHYGFSWTTHVETARGFARECTWCHQSAVESHGASHAGPGLILETVVDRGTILAIHDNNGVSFNEGEVVVDPFRLGPVRVVERRSKMTSEEMRAHHEAMLEATP